MVISRELSIEAATEKPQGVVQLTSNKTGGKEVQEIVNSINKGYKEQVTITQLEEALDGFQQFHVLQQLYQDYLKQFWGTLSGFSGKYIYTERCFLLSFKLSMSQN